MFLRHGSREFGLFRANFQKCFFYCPRGEIKFGKFKNKLIPAISCRKVFLVLCIVHCSNIFFTKRTPANVNRSKTPRNWKECTNCESGWICSFPSVFVKAIAVTERLPVVPTTGTHPSTQICFRCEHPCSCVCTTCPGLPRWKNNKLLFCVTNKLSLFRLFCNFLVKRAGRKRGTKRGRTTKVCASNYQSQLLQLLHRVFVVHSFNLLPQNNKRTRDVELNSIKGEAKEVSCWQLNDGK